jgi:hypothetical protein
MIQFSLFNCESEDFVFFPFLGMVFKIKTKWGFIKQYN